MPSDPSDSPATGGTRDSAATTGAARPTQRMAKSCCIATGPAGGSKVGMTEQYVELHCHSAFSLLDGAALPETLIERAAQLGYPALALTDHDELGGAVR